MKKALKGINKSAVIVALILVIPVVLYFFLNFYYKNKILTEQREEKKRNQEAFDTCIHRAEYEFERENRNMCWVYNHDAIDCDLTYWEEYGLGDKPLTKFKKAYEACEEKFPVAERLYSTTSPDFKSLLDRPLGNLTEREAVRKILELQEFKEFVKPPIEEGYKLRYNVESPTDEVPYWLVHVFKDSTSGDEITLNYYKIDAFTGEVSVVTKE